MKNCPSCKKEISRKAQTCPNCGHPIKKKTSGCAVFIALIFIVFIFSAMLVNSGSLDSAGGETENIKESTPRTDAIVMAQQFVEKNLKSPRSAKFPWSFDEYNVYALEGEGYENSYEVNGYVDAENSFGAMIRNQFTVQMKNIGNDQWQLLDIKID